MQDEVLERYISSYLELQPDGAEVVFCWHGGEPLLSGQSFYERVMELQQRYRGNHVVLNTIQTNGTLLTEEWCRWLRDHRFLVGISIDGPEDVHDYYRRNGSGRGSFVQVMEGIERMQRMGVEYNIMAVINDRTAAEPLRVYRFLRSLGTPYLQFSPNVERIGNRLTPSSVSAEAFGRFYCSIFDEWYNGDIGQTYVQLFDATLASLMQQPSGVCLYGEQCGHAAVLEADGTVYCCDHFATREYKVGNMMDSSAHDLFFGERMLAFRAKKGDLHEDCRSCPYLELCYGECPKNRFAVHEQDHAPYRNYLCEGYKMYFQHTMPRFLHMKQEILQTLN